MIKVLFNIFSLTINWVCIILFVLSGIATQINPNVWILPSVLSIGFLFFAIANILFVFYWLIRKKWSFIFSLFFLFLFAQNLFNFCSLTIVPEVEQRSENTVKILSYNVKLFDFFKKNKKGENKIISYILEQDADVVCLQEFGYFNKKGFLSEHDIQQSLSSRYPYSYVETHKTRKGQGSYGVATFSKFPILKKEKVNYQTDFNYSIYTDIKINKDTFRIFNCHLESNRLTIDDKKKMFEMMETKEEERIETMRLLAKKFGESSKIRANQVDVVQKLVHNGDVRKVIVCGDFNDIPNSYTYKKIKGSFVDAFVATSSGVGVTYNEMPFYVRIDYFLCSKEIALVSYKRGDVLYSDHYPIQIEINN